ncbi:MAG: exodeoxyribonuclease VII small subunit [Paludibacteraceae bacterium]|nr:exodeoxyribonuclease VII small subunit [Paludibacteraceae bacterium]
MVIGYWLLVNGERLMVMEYDEKIKRAEEIITQLEQAEAISLEEYKKLAAEATSLLHQCSAEIQTMAEELKR